jgi:hypothetical protein
MGLDASAIFEQELATRGLAFERDGDDLYRVCVNGLELTINLENARRNAERDGDPDGIRDFVAQILLAGATRALSWTEAAPRLLLKAEPSDYEFGDTIRLAVSTEVCRVLTLTDAEHSYISWVTTAMCSDWGVAPEQAIEAALRNQDALIDGLALEVDDVSGQPLGMVPLGSPYKASVIFAPSFKRLVEARFGWPVWVVVPCRDFVYVLQENSELVDRIGCVVTDEYRSSGYPLTTEVLRVGSDGIEAVGAFPKA